MGSYTNIQNCMEGNLSDNGGKQQTGNLSLDRQLSSLYSLTFGELQNTFSGLGKDFGSMNMDELLKNLWSVDETHLTTPTAAEGAQIGNLQKQGSLTLPRTLSQKTVDEVWRNLLNETSSDMNNNNAPSYTPNAQQRGPNSAEMTLEEFLVRAGVVREDAQPISKPNDCGFYGVPVRPVEQNEPNLGFQKPKGIIVNSIGNNNISLSNQPSPSLALNIAGLMAYQDQPKPLFPKQAKVDFASPMNVENNSQLTTFLDISDTNKKNGIVKLSPDVNVVSPSPYVYHQGTRGRKSSGGFEKVVERRHRRMIKNRESAARSRARKQAYTLELEAEIALLKERNEELQKKQEKHLEMRKKEIIEKMKLSLGGKRVCLRRTLTGPW